MQKTLIALAVICLAQLSYAALPLKQFDEPLKTDFQMWHDNCEIYIPGVTQEEINQVRAGRFDTNNQSIKNYAACIWLESKILNTDMVMNKALLDIYMPKKIMEDEYIGYLLCAKKFRKQNIPFADKVFGLIQCNYNRNPNDFTFI
ncbi:uncharacterized protein LOC114336481 [Diabrotica virgifera virgifera]|uniref:Uncharacterized protein LOC114336481 n=1 Tax=Diabrotica virgifera virgifera TaxID=50390 RepID=A0A6P7G1B2_DIAVI|nr:uncharacterized protein LOC114336481 [Diabrotica virgifera virgifera]